MFEKYEEILAVLNSFEAVMKEQKDIWDSTESVSTPLSQ